MKKSYELILGLLLILVVFTGLSMVSAADVNSSSDSSSISDVNSNTQTSDLLTGADYSNYQTSVDNSSEYSNEYSSNLNDVAVLSDGNTTTINTGSYNDLANLINNNSNGTVSLEHNYTYNTLLDGNYISGVNITKDLVINGNGYTISGNNQPVGILNIINSTVTLNDLNLINVKSTSGYYYGGGIFGVDSTIFVNNCHFTNLHESAFGGAISTEMCNLTVNDSSFTNNSAPFNGGAIESYISNVTITDCQFYNNIVNTTEIMNGTNYCGGGAISIEYGQILISDSIFNGNTATGNETNTYVSEGGAILLLNTTGFVNNCWFNNNSANAAAGAIWSWYNTLGINETIFTNNVAKRNGGAVLVDGNLYVNDSIFKNNIVNSTNPLTDFIYGGGALYQYNGEIYVENSEFDNNIADGTLNNSGTGGAIHIFNTTNAELVNNHFNDNVASNYGGAIYSDDGVTNVNNSTFTNNIAFSGGAISVSNVNLNVNNSDFDSNSANYSGAIRSNNCNTSVIDSYFYNNSANYSGGAIRSFGKLNIINSVFTQNSAKAYAGAINAINANITNSILVYNTAVNGGGALCLVNSTVNYCIILNNTAINGSAIAYYDNYDANYNWWGNNTPFNGTNNNGLICRYINSIDNVFESADNWVLMSSNINATNVTLGDIIKETVDFTHYTDGNNIYNMTSLIPEMPVIFGCDDGYTINKTRITDNNTIYVDYYAKSSGNFTLYATVPFETLTCNITVNPLTNKSTVLDTPVNYFFYGNNTYTGTLLDSNGNGVVYRTVSLNLTRISDGAWKVYNVTTNYYGVYSLPITLSPGRYLVKGSFAGDNDYYGSTDEAFMGIHKGYIIADNINATYGDNTSLIGYAYDSNNNPLVNKTITISLLRTATGQWKFYYVNTDSEGKYTLPIHLSPGTYFEDSYYSGDTNIRTISFIIINNATSDNRVPTSTILMDTNTNTIFGYLIRENLDLIPNANITLEITRLSNGACKNYTVTTDNKGFFIFPTVLSGDFKVVASYNGTSIYQPSKFVGYTTF